MDEPNFHLKESDLNSDSDSEQTVDDYGDEKENDDNGNNKMKKAENKDYKFEYKRKRKANEEEWSRQKTKAKRVTGQDYVGYTRNREGHNKKRDDRKMGRTCISEKCLKYKNPLL